MRDLSTVRDGWEAVEAEETRLLRALTVEQGLRDFLVVQVTCEPQFQLTDALFRPDREARLVDLQKRLRRLGQRMDKMENLYRSVVAMQQRLYKAGVPSAIIGGIAQSVWGIPRATRDVDLKVLLDRDSSERLLQILGNDYRYLHSNPLANLRGNGMVFVIDPEDVRVDLLLADTPYDERVISRAVEFDLMAGLQGRVCTAEDLIILKLISTREQDHVDAAAVVRRQAAALDHAYVRNWLRQFEQALDDSTLLAEYDRLVERYGK